MSWITPDLIEILLSILKAVVILLVVVTCGAFMSFGERHAGHAGGSGTTVQSRLPGGPAGIGETPHVS